MGSGMILRLGTSRRRGIEWLLYDFLLASGLEASGWARARSGLRALDAVLGSLGVPVRLVGAARAVRARRVQRAAHHVVTHTRQVLHAAAADQHDAVFLKVVPFTRNVAGHFHAVGQSHAADLAQG